MPYNFLLIPIIFSYIILRYSSFFKFNLQRRSKDVLVFETIVLSIPIILTSIALNWFFKTNHPSEFKESAKFLGNNIFDSKTRYFYSFFFGSICCTILIFFTQWLIITLQRAGFINNNYFSNRAVRKYGDELEKFIAERIKKGDFAQFSLKNGKVYIGFCTGTPIPGMNNFIKVIPFYSGYRNKETHNIEITTEYVEVIDNLLKEDDYDKILLLGISFKKDEILSFSIYHPEIFKKFNPINNKSVE
ncbi:hypothetical protein [Empedobacter brevis]|uniref:hypothetical protein n=1 Tax=Empedobacter brevis TaxID=247 RepID=UPI00289DEB62|nr:hypothetical protein [Empedobacter brevis]